MASGSGDDPRHSISMKGNGRMPDNVGYDNTAYHEFLQHYAYIESLNSPYPPLIIFEPDANPHFTNQSENMPDLPPDFQFEPLMEEKLQKQPKSNLFVLHMKKVKKADGSTIAVCNYCKKVFKWSKSEGYGSYRKHITNSHPDALARPSSQAQISRYATPNQQLFKYSDEKNREELARMVAVKHLLTEGFSRR